MRTASLLLVAQTNVDFVWNVVLELPGASFPVTAAMFRMVAAEPTQDRPPVLTFDGAATDGSLSIVVQDADAESVTLAFYRSRAAIAALRGSYPATLSMTLDNGRTCNLAVGVIEFEQVT